MKKNCMQCGADIIGRSDKKFCDDQCRSLFNNKERIQKDKIIYSVNRVLRKNYTILKALAPQGICIVDESYLTLQGFNFKYFTSLFTTSHDNIYRFCYDLGYIRLNDGKIRIIKHTANKS